MANLGMQASKTLFDISLDQPILILVYLDLGPMKH